MKAIDVHAHTSTQPGVRSMLKFQQALLKYYMHMEVDEEQALSMFKSPEDMAQDFVSVDVKGILVGWDAETATGMPPVPNDHLADLVKKFPQAFAGAFGCVDPRKGKAAVDEAERCVKKLGLMGIKFHPSAQGFYPNDRAFYPLWEACRAMKIPLQFHTGTTGLGAGAPGGGGVHLKYAHPFHLDDLAADFPDLTIILCHPGWPWTEENLMILLHKSNTFMDLSGWAPKYFPEPLKREMKGRLQDRVMFGSDYPLIPHERLFQEYEAMGLSSEVLEKIYVKNAERVFSLKLP